MKSVHTILNDYDFGQWVDFVDRFMTRYSLWPKSGSAWVAVSGGRDSILLLWSMFALFKRGRIQRLKMLHFNHQTRSGCQDEEALVVQYSKLLQLPLEIAHPLSPMEGSNLEHRAREERYAFFRRRMGRGDRVYLGHHLDDSWEWSLMARLKSSRLKSQLGIPVVHGGFARPFLCVTREQVTQMVKKMELEWLEDDSNRDERFERNFLRSHVISSIKKRFPTYLKHYVASSNELARKMGVWRGGNELPFKQKKLPLGGVALFNFHLENKFEGAQGLIRGIVEKLSLGHRGCLATQVDKMIDAAAKGRQGPIFFSGSVRGYMAPGVLFFIRASELGAWKGYDRAIVRAIGKKTSLASIPFQNMEKRELVEYIGAMPFPPIGVGNLEGQWHPEGQHFLLPKTSALFKKRGWRLKSLIKMAREMDKGGKKGRILPLNLLAEMGDFYCTGNVPKARMEGRV